MSNKKNIKSKVQTFSFVLANGTTAGRRNYSVVLENEFKNCRGFYLIRNNTSQDYVKVGVIDGSSNVILEPTNAQHLTVSQNPPIKDRFFRETPFEANGRTINVSVENFANASQDQTFDMLFLLDNEEI